MIPFPNLPLLNSKNPCLHTYYLKGWLFIELVLGDFIGYTQVFKGLGLSKKTRLVLCCFWHLLLFIIEINEMRY
jgi:hypothetical protein